MSQVVGYTFSGPNGQSDINVTLLEDVNARCVPI